MIRLDRIVKNNVAGTVILVNPKLAIPFQAANINLFNICMKNCSSMAFQPEFDCNIYLDTYKISLIA